MFRTRLILAVAFVLSAALAQAAKKADYPFAVSPDKAFPLLVKLEQTSGKTIDVTEDERRLFADAADGKLDQVSFAEACLIASGVLKEKQREAYLSKLDEIEKGARAAIAEAKTAHEKGEKLLKFLHAGPMAKGYASEQTDLHTILDEGTFNCVSSAVLYNVIGRRLGLDLRAVEIPGHVFSVLHDGSRSYDVETTNALGFDPKDRSKVTKPGGEAYVPERHAGQRREVGEAGLAAIIAYNHGVTLGKDNRFHEAILANFRALALDRSNPGASNNAQADFTNWVLALSKEKKFEDSLNVADIGLELNPNCDKLQNNARVCWVEFAESTMEAGKDSDALVILRRAAKALPKEDFDRWQSGLFCRKAEESAKASKWEDALAVADRGLKLVDAKPRAELAKYRAGLFLHWSNEIESKGDHDAALVVLKRAMKEDPKDSRFRHNMVALFDSRAGKLIDKKDWSGAIAVYETALKELPGDSHLKHNLDYCRQESKR